MPKPRKEYRVMMKNTKLALFFFLKKFNMFVSIMQGWDWLIMAELYRMYRYKMN